ncbi:MAG: ABC transporter permease subunit [Anaerolineae bacterium]|nr:ABC transporter permease subunit [Anaerolineae bacterium]
MINITIPPKTRGLKIPWSKDLQQNWTLYLLFIPTAVYFIVFNYIPMFGILIAFEDFKVSKGVFGSRWVGLQNFIDLFTGETFPLAMRNTVAMAMLNLTIGFVLPIIFAIFISEIQNKKFKRVIQIITYMPHFVAAVVVAQLVREFVGSKGAITQLLTIFGFEQQNWLANPQIPVFWLINLFTGVWQEIGFGSIIFVAAIANVSQEFHEAAAVDGASRFQRIIGITLPTIKPLIIMLFVLRCGLFFTVGFDKILLLYMPSTYVTADVLSTYTYRMAFSGAANYGLSTASGLFQSIASLLLLITSNTLSKKLSKTSLF